MFNVFMAILAEKLIVTEQEAEALAKHLNNAMLPSEFREAQKLVRKIFQKL